MSDKSSASSSGLGFTGALAIAFIVLKLTGVISWPWWWVLAPIWFPGLVVAIACVIVVILAVIAYFRDERPLKAKK